MTELTAIDNEITENKNKNTVCCRYCNSIILCPLKAYYTKQDFNLPLLHQKTKTTLDNVEAEMVSDYWTVDDMFTFENIGFSNTVDNTKYLICAECDMGPFGYHDITTKKSYIALKRVNHST